MMPEPERIHLVLRPLRSDVPVEVRLRHLLKFALRTCGFQCLECRDEPPPEKGVDRV